MLVCNLKLEVTVGRLTFRVQFGFHTDNHFVFSQHHCLLLPKTISISMPPESCPILIKEGEATNAVIGGVVDGDWSDLVDCILGYLKVILSRMVICLIRPVSIAQDEVEVMAYTVFHVVLKPTEWMKHSIPLLNHGSSWVFKLEFVVCTTYYLT
jgi:hypothetical protein